MLPESIRPAFEEQLRRVHAIHQQDLAEAFGEAPLSNALAPKYPRAAGEWSWQYVFPATGRWRDSATGRQGRHHQHERTMIYTHVLNRGGYGVRSPAGLL